MRKFVRAAVLVAAAAPAALVVACGDEGDPVETTAAGIQVTVRADGAAEPGVAVALFATGGATALAQATTNASGQATFSELEPGGYDVEIQVPEGLELDAGQTARRSVTLTAGQTQNLTFDLVTPLPPGVQLVTLQGTSFSPSTLTISTGTTVRWRNEQSVFHTITPDGHNEWTAASVSNAGDTFEHTFNTAGTFPYYCEPHRSQGMTGTITVQ